MGAHDPSHGHDPAPRLSVAIALTTDPTTTRALLDRFCYALGLATGLDLEPRGVLPSQQLLTELAEGQIQLAWLPPILALRATLSQHVVPIALPVRAGAALYRAVLFARPEGPIRTLADLRGLRAAWVHQQSATGYLLIRAHLEAEGVVLREAFVADAFLGTHEDVAQAVLAAEADVGASYLYPDEQGPDRPPLRAGWGEAAVRVVAQTALLPADIIAGAERMAPSVLERVQQALIAEPSAELGDAARALFAADGFIAPTAQHLEPLRRLVVSLKEAPTTVHSLFPPPPGAAPRGGVRG